ncbi:MAG: DUF4340 domain-containing protein, partial [Gammaproteobacteria bacterium]
LTLGAALAILIAVLLGAELANDKAQVPGEPLFNTMRDDINAITRITITAGGDEVVATLSRQGDEWRVAERHGYPADAGKLRQVLLGLADARLVEAKTANPAYYPRLGVEDITAEDAGGVLVEVATESSQYNVIVGDPTQGDYRYVRRAGEAGSWLIDQNPEAPSETADWLNDAIIDVETTLVHSVDIEHPDGEAIRLEKANVGQTDFTVTKIPVGRELSYASVGNVVGGVLDNLTLDDVGPAAAPGAETVTTTYRTFDGQVIRISCEASDSKYWIQVAASHDAELAARLSAPLDEAGGEAPAANSQENVSAAVAALNQRTQQWRYQIPQYKYEQLTRRWEDLLKAAE